MAGEPLSPPASAVSCCAQIQAAGRLAAVVAAEAVAHQNGGDVAFEIDVARRPRPMRSRQAHNERKRDARSVARKMRTLDEPAEVQASSGTIDCRRRDCQSEGERATHEASDVGVAVESCAACELPTHARLATSPSPCSTR